MRTANYSTHGVLVSSTRRNVAGGCVWDDKGGVEVRGVVVVFILF